METLSWSASKSSGWSGASCGGWRPTCCGALWCRLRSDRLPRAARRRTCSAPRNDADLAEAHLAQVRRRGLAAYASPAVRARRDADPGARLADLRPMARPHTASGRRAGAPGSAPGTVGGDGGRHEAGVPIAKFAKTLPRASRANFEIIRKQSPPDCGVSPRSGCCGRVWLSLLRANTGGPGHAGIHNAHRICGCLSGADCLSRSRYAVDRVAVCQSRAMGRVRIVGRDSGGHLLPRASSGARSFTAVRGGAYGI